MNPLAVLFSGGLDSAILVGAALRQARTVYPIYVRCGLVWETVEFDYMRNFLGALRGPHLKPLVILEQTVIDVYGPHWSITGKGIPGADSLDQAVFLPGRNLFLLNKALLWCHLNEVPTLALGALQSNPFPDALPAFFQDYVRVVNQAFAGKVALDLPFLDKNKAAVMQLGQDLPLEHTFSCMNPISSRHCGICNKCAERKQAFAQVPMKDPTKYVY